MRNAASLLICARPADKLTIIHVLVALMKNNPLHTGLSRRHFLMGTGALAGSSLLPLAHANEWKNWSGAQTATPDQFLFATSEDEIASAVRAARQVRAVGGSHSFSPVVPTPGTLISLERLNGLVRHDAATHQATLRAGTRLAQASAELAAVGQSMLNEPDINMQSLGGAISTATHGTGTTLNCMSACVQALRLVTATGDILDCSASQNSELFRAAQVAVGSLGIITEVTLQNAPAYKLRETVKTMNMHDALEWVHANRDQHRHIEFWGFVAGNEAIVKLHDISTDPDTPPVEASIDENDLLEFAANTARRLPWLNRWIQELVGAFVDEGTRVGPSGRIFPSPRAVPFNEMEYQIPLETGVQCFHELTEAIQKSGIQVFFPLEYRYVKADDLWLSPFQGRDAISISVHQYARQDYRPLFAVAEPVFRKYGGRPHWGKLHTQNAASLAALYPHWKEFQRVREAFDPTGKFLNAHLRELFGVPEGA